MKEQDLMKVLGGEELSFSNIQLIIDNLKKRCELLERKIESIEFKTKEDKPFHKDLSSLDIQFQYKISRTKIESSRKNGSLKFFKNGGSVWYKRKDVEDWWYGGNKDLT